MLTQPIININSNIFIEADNLNIDALSYISSSNYGYSTEGIGESVGTNRSGNGGSHGGLGNIGYNSSNDNVGIIYGVGLNPITTGSSGGTSAGNGSGGKGGGYIRLIINNSLVNIR